LSVDLFAGDLLAFMNALGLQKCILCGISMGGYITLRALEKEPAAIAGLVLCDTTSLADTNEAKLKRFGSIESILGSGASAYAGEFIRTIFSEDTLNAKSEPVERIHKMISSTPADVLCATLLALASRTDTTQILEKINVPTLILRGEFDRIIGHDHALALHMGIRNSRQATIADAAHLPNLENPEAFNSCLSGFLSAFLR
jgi:pimeloyl-ACP methyl ester carboxylesterase